MPFKSHGIFVTDFNRTWIAQLVPNLVLNAKLHRSRRMLTYRKAIKMIEGLEGKSY